jgi:hypothetical protein
MTLLETFQSIADNIGVTLHLGDANERNLGLDSIKPEEFPVLFIVPYTVNDKIDKGGLVHSNIVFEGFFLSRLANKPTIDFKFMEAETEAIQPMRAKARLFVNNFNASAIADKTQNAEGLGFPEPSHTPTYGDSDAHLFGVYTKGKMFFVEGLGTCTH